MYKVVIVDDEVISRVGIAGIIPWEKYGFEVIGHASNGAEAFEMFKKEKPDLVFTDVITSYSIHYTKLYDRF